MSQSDTVTVERAPRDVRLDALRGVALLLMLLDHFLVVILGAGYYPDLFWLRRTVTRLSLPLFMVTSGILLGLRGGFSSHRRFQILLAALWINALLYLAPVGLGGPDILALWLAVGIAWRIIVRFPVEVLVLGILQTISLPITLSWWANYQPGYVAAWVALGVLISRLPAEPWFVRAAVHLPAWVRAVGRHPLPWYVGHMTAAIVLGIYLME